MSLATTFALAQQTYEKLETSHFRPNSDEYQAIVKKGLEGFERCAKLVRDNDVFSSNEEADDINTEDLKYLLIPYYLGMLTLKISEFEPPKRLPILQQSRRLLLSFVIDGERIGTVKKSDRENYAELDKKDPATKRSILIARAQREKAAKERMKFAREKQLKRAARSNEADGELDNDDEEEMRDYSMAMIESCSLQAFDSLKSTKMEIDMLSQIVKMPEKPKPDPKMQEYQVEQTDELRKIAAALGGAMGSSGANPSAAAMREYARVAAPMESDRKRLQDGVFQYGHNLPTMTIEEFAELEIAEAHERQEKERAAEAAKVAVDSDCEEEVDKATYKAREWDKFTDDNQKGAGNTKR